MRMKRLAIGNPSQMRMTEVETFPSHSHKLFHEGDWTFLEASNPTIDRSTRGRDKPVCSDLEVLII